MRPRVMGLSSAIAVSLGGALGALSRYALGLSMASVSSWPWPTFLANGLGCLLMGCCAGYLHQVPVAWAPWLKLLVTTGFLGGFTTYSSFSLEVLTHWQAGRWGVAGSYLAATWVVCLLSVAFGWALGDRLYFD